MASNLVASANVSLGCVKAKADFDVNFPMIARATGVDIRDRTAGGVKEVAWGTLMGILGDWSDAKAAQRCFDEILKAEGIPVGSGFERLRRELKP